MEKKGNDEFINSLVSRLVEYKKKYYLGEPTITDEAFDTLENELREATHNNHPYFEWVGYSLASPEGKVNHETPMLSLSKTYLVSDLETFCEKGEVLVSPKIDGMAISITYNEKGKLIQASTRGNGFFGEDVTQKILFLKNVPKNITPVTGVTLEIRGEVYFPISEFGSFSSQFESYRNAVPGTFARKDLTEALAVLGVLKFYGYDVLFLDSSVNPQNLKIHTHQNKLEWLESLGFDCGIHQNHLSVVNSDNISNLSKIVEMKFGIKHDFSIDGLVFRLNDELQWKSLGFTSHHPRGSLAFKRAGESASTKITAIEHFVNRSGRVSFRAKLDPVYLSGAKITFATLHNADFIENGNYAPGATVKVIRSGEVIPYIVANESPSTFPYALPTTCPCGFLLSREGVDLYCHVKENCPTKDIESLIYFAKKIDFVGISEKTILKLHEVGLLQKPADFFVLKKEELSSIDGLGEKSAENMLRSIENKKTRVPLHILLTALGLKRGGEVKCKEVAKAFPSLNKIRSLKTDDLVSLPGWAQKSAQDFVDSLSEKSKILDELLKVVTLEEPSIEPSNEKESNTQPKALNNLSICITGALSVPRNTATKILESAGAKIVSSLSASTSLLLCNEPAGSSKTISAKKFGTRIISEKDLAIEWGVLLISETLSNHET